MFKFSIKIPIYHGKCHVIIDEDIEKVINKYVKKHNWNELHHLDDNETVEGYVATNEDLNYYCFFKQSCLTPNVISHEITHIVDYILTEKGIELVGESRAYITGHITEKIFDFILKNNLLINKWLEKESSLLKSQSPSKLSQDK